MNNYKSVYYSNKIQVLLFILIYLFAFSCGYGQSVNPIPVTNGQGQPLKYPWAGGMNSIQFGEIDLNRDGLKDLLAFDRNGNRVMCFVNNGVYNDISYTFRPDLARFIPELSDWAVFRDYDNDGRTDIFTYSPGWAGMKVYRNISDNLLKFDLVVSPFLKTFQENGYVNLLVTNVDYPGIADIDLDGDLDILSFWGLGSFVNFHKNLSMEKYGHADSLDYALEEYCWGFFAESEESNQLYFDTCFTGNSPDRNERHTGSTFLLLDLDNDTVQDLLLGDVDYPGLPALYNGGDKNNAVITHADDSFPESSEAVRLFSFPVAVYTDVNNDFKKDLLVSSFEPGLEASRNFNSVWLYTNTGIDQKPFFSITTKSFLQGEMLDRGSGAYPVLYDWNGDGLLDLFVGNFGFYQYSFYENTFLRSVYKSRVAYYQNTGTDLQPSFVLTEEDFGGLDALEKTGFIPTFGDVDGDGDTDMLAGYDAGKIIFVRNDNGNMVVETDSYLDIDVDDFSAPQLFDLDQDGLDDLIIGEKRGNVNYFRNTGTAANPFFEKVTDSLGKINVTDNSVSLFGYSVPSFFRLEDGATQLVVGSEQGKLFHYANIDGNLEGKWTEAGQLDQVLDTSNVNYDRGARTGAAIGYITRDGKPEMIAGNYSGGLEYFNGNAEVIPGTSPALKKRNRLWTFPNPAGDYVDVSMDDGVQFDEIVLFNLNGLPVEISEIQHPSPRRVRLKIANLPDGIYIIKASSGNTGYYGKIVVQHQE